MIVDSREFSYSAQAALCKFTFERYANPNFVLMSTFAASFQADRFVDRKLNQAEDILKKKQKSAKKWYSNMIGDSNGPKLNEFHIFIISFAAGVALGVGTA